MFTCLSLIVPLAKLLFDFLRNHVNRGIQVTFDIFSKKVGPGKGNSDSAAKLAVGRFGLVMLKSDSDIGRVLIEMIELINPRDEMILDGLGERQIMCRKNQVHVVRMHQSEIKSSERVSLDLG